MARRWAGTQHRGLLIRPHSHPQGGSGSTGAQRALQHRWRTSTEFSISREGSQRVWRHFRGLAEGLGALETSQGPSEEGLECFRAAAGYSFRCIFSYFKEFQKSLEELESCLELCWLLGPHGGRLPGQPRCSVPPCICRVGTTRARFGAPQSAELILKALGGGFWSPLGQFTGAQRRHRGVHSSAEGFRASPCPSVGFLWQRSGWRSSHSTQQAAGKGNSTSSPASP